ncbi:MAG: SDR family oxidoreductase [Alphaproteobacteria bacterium]|nr:SDR family oxidoreductase [Alphaproteobacteria bacterium]
MKNKIVLITGGSRGIGLSTAKEFLARGATVIVLHRDSSVKIDIPIAKEIIVDISDEQQVKNAVDSIVQEFGRIDILINNAGIAIDKDFDTRTIDDWKMTLDTNLIGTWLLSKYVSKIMLKNKYGKIINVISSNWLDEGTPDSIDYYASKAGIADMTRNLARKFAPYINVNNVALGWVDTDMNDGLPDDYIKETKSKIWFERWANPSEVAKPICFLASDDASYITGTTLTIDGGH